MNYLHSCIMLNKILSSEFYKPDASLSSELLFLLKVDSSKHF